MWQGEGRGLKSRIRHRLPYTYPADDSTWKCFTLHNLFPFSLKSVKNHLSSSGTRVKGVDELTLSHKPDPVFDSFEKILAVHTLDLLSPPRSKRRSKLTM